MLKAAPQSNWLKSLAEYGTAGSGIIDWLYEDMDVSAHQFDHLHPPVFVEKTWNNIVSKEANIWV